MHTPLSHHIRVWLLSLVVLVGQVHYIIMISTITTSCLVLHPAVVVVRYHLLGGVRVQHDWQASTRINLLQRQSIHQRRVNLSVRRPHHKWCIEPKENA